MNPQIINIITNIIAALLVILEPVRAYLLTETFSWMTFALCLGAAIIGYFTSKSTLSTIK